MTARWWALGTWALVAASLLYWSLRLFVPATPAPAHTSVAATTLGPRGDLTRLLGVDPPPTPADSDDEPAPAESSRFQLVGVVSPRGGSVSQGVALIAVDGQAPKAYRVGAAIEGDTVLHSVRPRGAMLGPRGQPANVTLEIPPPAPASTGTLPAAVSGAPQAVPPPAVPPQAAQLPMPGAAARPMPNQMPPLVRPPLPISATQMGNAPRPPTPGAQPAPESE